MYGFACTARVRAQSALEHAKAYILLEIWIPLLGNGIHVSDSQGLVKNILYITQGFILDAM